MSTTNTNLAPIDRVLQLAKEKGMSGKGLARAAEISESIIPTANGKKGQARQDALSLPTLRTLARVLGVPTEALLGEAAATPAPAAAAVSLTVTLQGSGQPLVCLRQLKPSLLNPRKTIEPELVEELAASIKEQGLLQNLVVRPTGSTGRLDDREVPYFEIISGERRFRALELLAKDGTWPELVQNIPVKVIDGVDDALHLELALIENLQRQDVNPIEEAEALKRLQQLDPKKWSGREIARKLGTSEGYVRQRLNMIDKLVEPVRQLVQQGKLSVSQARMIVLEDPKEQLETAKHAIENGLNHEGIRDYMVHGFVPVERAIFPLEDCGLEIIEVDDESYFPDKEAFKKVQKAAAVQLAGELRKEWAWAKTAGYGTSDYFYSGQYTRSKDKTIAGCVVEIKYDGVIKVHRGLVKPEDRAETPDGKAATAEQKAEEKRREAIRKACDKFDKDLAAAIEAAPQIALRLFFFDLLVETDDQLAPAPEIYGGAEGVPLNAFAARGKMLFQIADMVTKNDMSTKSMRLSQKADPVQAWRKLAKVSEQQLVAAMAPVIASRVSCFDTDEIPPIALEIAAELGVEVPEILRPEGQQDLEQAPRAKKKAA